MSSDLPDRALGIPDVLDSIFDYTDRSTLAVCGRVCKSWSPALDGLWKDIKSFVPLMQLLSPLHKYSNQVVSDR